MAWLYLRYAISVLACFGHTFAIRQEDSLHTFSLAVASKENPKRDFILEWAAVHRKWGNGMPESVVSTFSLADNDGRVSVHPTINDDIFIADVVVGNPPQILKMALDTGSSDFWVQSTDTSYRINKDGPWAPRYRPDESTSSNLLQHARWDVQYLDGTAAHGIVYHDTVKLGDFKVKNATVQSAQAVTSRFETETNLSGILGLAKSLPNNIEPPAPTFLHMLKPLLKSPVFTVDLRKNATGRFDFGHLDTSVALEELTWIESDPESLHWDIKLNLTSWTGNDNTWWYFDFMATIDTGTTLMFLPDGLASMYWFDVPGMRTDNQLNGVYTFPCSGSKDLPDLQFKLPGTEHVLTIPGWYLNYGPVEDDAQFCWGGMQSAQGLDVTVLGDVMLKALFVAFDIEKNRIGFANKRLME